jgi:hypothetical protein
MDQVRSEAVRLSGEVLRDMEGRFWRRPEWRLTVTNESGADVLSLQVSARKLADNGGGFLGTVLVLA